MPGDGGQTNNEGGREGHAGRLSSVKDLRTDGKNESRKAPDFAFENRFVNGNADFMNSEGTT